MSAQRAVSALAAGPHTFFENPPLETPHLQSERRDVAVFQDLQAL